MATVYLVVENHPDRCVERAYMTEQSAQDFCDRPCNNPPGHRMYSISTVEVDDDEVLVAAEKIMGVRTC